MKIKIDRLMDVYLEGTIELLLFQEKKNSLMEQQADFQEKLVTVEREGNQWLELTRNWILQANQANNLLLQENASEMKHFLKTIGSNRTLADKKLAIDFPQPWSFLQKANARTKGARNKKERNIIWWRILSLARTYFEQHHL